MTAKSNYDQTVWDANTACDILWVPRSGPYNLSTFLKNPSLSNLAKAFQEGPSPSPGSQSPASWLADGEDNHVVACSWNKDTLSPAGVFSFQLKALKRYLEAMTPGDLILIWMDDRRAYSTATRGTGTLITMGIVDRVTQAVSTTGDGVDTQIINVNGRDFGAIFQETATAFDPSFSALESLLFNSQYFEKVNAQQSIALSPVENVLTLLDLVYNQKASGSAIVGAQWQIPGVEVLPSTDDTGLLGDIELQSKVSLLSFLDITTFMQVPMYGYSLQSEPLAISQTPNVWALIEGYSNGVVNEMFIDVRDYSTQELDLIRHLGNVAASYVSDGKTPNSPDDQGKQRTLWTDIATNSVFQSLSAKQGLQATDALEKAPLPVLALVFRQRPYDLDAWNRLPTHEVQITEVFETDFGYSTHDLVNFFRIRFPNIEDVYQELAYGVLVNAMSVLRFGIRRLEAQSRYPFDTSVLASDFDTGKTKHTTPFSESFDYYLGLLSVWNAANDKMLSGQIHLRFRPDIRVGSRLRLRTTLPGQGSVTKGATTPPVVYEFYVQGVSHQFAWDPGSSRTSVTVVRGIRVGGTGIENNLKWTSSDYGALPPQLNTYARMTASGFKYETLEGEKVINDQITTFADPEIDTKVEPPK